MTMLVVALLLVAAPQGREAQVADGIRQVDEGDLEGAVVTLQDALARLAAANAPGPERAAGYLYLGMAQLGLDRVEAARTSLREAWSFNRGARLDPMRFPPRVVRLYQEVGQELRAEARDGKSKRGKVVLGAVAGLGLGAGLASLGGGTPAMPPPPPVLSPQPVSIRLFNNDDSGRVFLGGNLLREVAIGEDTGPVDVSSRLAPGANELAFELVNAHGGISYGFEVRVGESIVFQETCGIVFRAGCENDRKYPAGVVRRFTYVVQR